LHRLGQLLRGLAAFGAELGRRLLQRGLRGLFGAFQRGQVDTAVELLEFVAQA
jgi:hypothetical protein